jgi:hypothetical protein
MDRTDEINDERSEDIRVDKTQKPIYVDMIASGYEWTCPECDHFNSIAGWQENITCNNPNCGKTFKSNYPEHAYD